MTNTTNNTNTDKLTLWDFDDTLADSYEAVVSVTAANPEVPGWMWWHDSVRSTEAVMVTPAIVAMWERLVTTEGRHMILTGRNGDAVVAWMEQHKNDGGAVSEGIARIERVMSTSNPAQANVPTAVKKADIVEEFVAAGAEVTMVEDSVANLKAIAERCPSVTCVQVGTDYSAAQ